MLNPESDQARKDDVGGLQRDHDHFHEWLKSESERWSYIARRFQEANARRSGWRNPNVWLVLLTGLTLVVLSVYTWLTYDLRVSSLKQVAAANNQNQIARQQIDNTFFLPIVVLALDDSARLVVENIGFGPAVNSREVMIHGHDATLLLYHASSLRPGQAKPVAVFEDDSALSSIHKKIEGPDIERKLRQLFPEVSAYPGKSVCLYYADANAEWHETRQTIWFSGAPELKGMSGLVVQFKGMNKVGKEENACR